MGPLVKKVLKDTKDKIEGKSSQDRKLYFYFGHDSTVANFLQALKVWDSQIPVYMILAIVEVHQLKNNDYGIKVFLKNETAHDPYLLKLPGCDEICPLTHVVKATESIVPSDLKNECKAKKNTYTPPKESGP